MRIESTIRQGVESGWTIDQMARNIAGTATNNYTDGIFETSRKSAVNMARTLTNSIANNAKETFYRANQDVLEGVEILSTLDGRTCPVCAGLDRTRYKFDEPHPALPIHHQCRCVLLPVTPLSDLVEESRPMANADFMKEAERLYKDKYPNKDFSALADSTRKKYYHEAMREYERRTGKPAYTQVSGGVSFKDYLENHMTAQQQKDWLGPERYKLYKDYKLPLDRFIPPYPNKRMTIVELKEQDKASFNSIADTRNKKNVYNSVDFSQTPDMQIIDDTANLRRLNTSDGKKQWDIIPNKVKNILKHPKTKNIPKNFMLKSDPEFFGHISVNSNGNVVGFDVAHNNPHGALTAVHETGHLLDKIFIKPEQRNRILQTVKSSSEYKNMLQRYNDLKGLKLSKKEKKHLGTLKTLLDEDELLARSFTEYISRKNK